MWGVGSVKVHNKFLNANIIIIIFVKVDKGGGRELKQLSTKSGQFARFHNFTFSFSFFLSLLFFFFSFFFFCFFFLFFSSFFSFFFNKHLCFLKKKKYIYLKSFVQKENSCVTIHISQEIQCFQYAIFTMTFA